MNMREFLSRLDLRLIGKSTRIGGHGAHSFSVDMTLPNHAVNVMFVATTVLGSAVLITVANQIVRVLPDSCRSEMRLNVSFPLTVLVDGRGRGWNSHLHDTPSTILCARRERIEKIGPEHEIPHLHLVLRDVSHLLSLR